MALGQGRSARSPGPACAMREDQDVHPGDARRDVRLLGAALAMIATLMVVEVVVGIAASSLALLAAIGAARLAARPTGGRWTFGLARAEVVSAAANGVTLLVIASVIAV